MRTYPAELTPPISLWFPICYIVKDFMFVKTSKLLAANTTEFQKAESGLRVKVVFIWQVNGNFLSFQKNYSQTSVEASIHFFLPVRMLQQSSCYKSPGHLIHSTPLLALRPLVWMNEPYRIYQITYYHSYVIKKQLHFKDCSLHSLFSTKQTHRFNQ